jgi:hypothetical protein
MIRDPEGGFQVSNHRLPDLGHRHGSLPPRFHRRLAEPGCGGPGLIKEMEQVQTRPDVERQAVVGDPTVDRHSDRGNPHLSQENTPQVRPSRPLEIEFVQYPDNRLVEFVQISLESQAEDIKREGEVSRDLTWKMEYASTSSIDPVHTDSERPEQVVIGRDMRPAPFTTHTDRWWVLAENQACARPFADLVDQPALKLLHLAEIDDSQHEHFERGLVEGQHHRSIRPSLYWETTLSDRSSAVHRDRREQRVCDLILGL